MFIVSFVFQLVMAHVFLLIVILESLDHTRHDRETFIPLSRSFCTGFTLHQATILLFISST